METYSPSKSYICQLYFLSLFIGPPALWRSVDQEALLLIAGFGKCLRDTGFNREAGFAKIYAQMRNWERKDIRERW